MRRESGAALAVLILILVALASAYILSQTLSGSGKRLENTTRMNATLDSINEALVRFAQLNKRLPCPAAGASSTGVADPPGASADCTNDVGVVPWQTLDIPPAAAVDEWGRLVSYRVFDGVNGFTRINGLGMDDCLDSDVAVVYTLDTGEVCNATTHENTRSDFLNGKGLVVNDRGTVRPQVAYALISHGATGLGAFIPGSATAMSAPLGGSNERLNAEGAGTYWIMNPSDASVGVDQAAHFDDVVSYSPAASLVVTARIGGRPWPLTVLLDRTNTTGSPGGAMDTGVNSKKVAVTGGPVMVAAFPASSPAHNICVTVPTLTAMPYAIAPCTTGGGGPTLTPANGEGLSFDFRVRRRFLKILLADLDALESAQLTFYDGTTQVSQKLVMGCGTNTAGIFTIDTATLPGAKEFTRVEVTAVAGDFSIGSIAACPFDDATHLTCALPNPTAEASCPS